MSRIIRSPWVRHETEEDKRNEREVIAVLQGIRPDLYFEKLPDGEEADYRVWKSGKPYLCLEIRCRKNPRQKYETYYIDKDKIEHLMEEAKNYPLGSFVIVRWIEINGYSYGYFSVPHLPKEVLSYIRMGGASEQRRGDANDPQLVMHIPINHPNLLLITNFGPIV